MKPEQSKKPVAVMQLFIGFILTLFAVGGLSSSFPVSRQLGILTTSIAKDFLLLLVGLLLLVSGFIASRAKKENSFRFEVRQK